MCESMVESSYPLVLTRVCCSTGTHRVDTCGDAFIYAFMGLVLAFDRCFRFSEVVDHYDSAADKYH